MKLNENIKSLRKQSNMTLEELGSRIGVSKQTIQRYESGQIPNIPYDKIIALSDIFECTPSQLMGWENTFNVSNTKSSLHTTDELFEKEYGHTAYNAMKAFLKLDTIDQAKITERIDTLLESDKYNKEKELLNA